MGAFYSFPYGIANGRAVVNKGMSGHPPSSILHPPSSILHPRSHLLPFPLLSVKMLGNSPNRASRKILYRLDLPEAKQQSWPWLAQLPVSQKGCLSISSTTACNRSLLEHRPGLRGWLKEKVPTSLLRATPA